MSVEDLNIFPQNESDTAKSFVNLISEAEGEYQRALSGISFFPFCMLHAYVIAPHFLWTILV